MRVVSAKSLTMAAIVAVTMASPRLNAQQGRDEDVQGVLEVQVEDSATGAVVHHFLDTGTEKIRLRGNRADGSEFLGLVSGSVVRVHGRRSDASTLQLSNNGGSVTTLSLATTNTFGEQRVAVIMVNFQDNPATPYSWSDASTVTFGQVSDFYRENSYNQAWLTGDVFGWFTLPMSGSVCDTNQIATLADQAASSRGVNLNNYGRRVYAFPGNACSWWGLGTVGGSPSRAWINGTYSLKVVAHELGHNFGDYHSGSVPCDASGCSVNVYGDDRDIMGLSGTGHFHAYQKERFGWLNYGASPAIQTVTASGTYRISAYEDGSSPSALKILKAATSSDRTYYYVEARAQVGFDAPYVPGVLIHSGNSSNGNTAYEIDLDPQTAAFDSLLDPGQSFTDAAAGVTVKTVSADASGSWVEITYSGQPCATGSPNVTLSPGSSVTSPATTAAYSMTVKNNDQSGCGPASFGINMSVPAGWTWSPAQPAISVAPGSTAGTTVYVTPPVDATGTVNVSAMAERSGSGPGASATASLTVASGLSVSLVTTGGSQYQVSATVRAGGAPAANATVTFTITDPRGAVDRVSATTNSSGVATIKGRLKGKDPHGTYFVQANASSNGLTGVANGTFVY